MAIQSDSLSSRPDAPRIVAPQPVSPNEESIERALRPKALQEYVGQQRAREQLEIFIAAARTRGEALDHVLLCARRPAPCWSARAIWPHC
ncbi:hypothetical protein G6F31_020330 [Rhizopus arrhizus]|nr:hypothetical protein G6F31_020330 [Rhizopus arrhizus]